VEALLRKATVRPEPFGVDRLTIILFDNDSADVVGVVLGAWNKPEVEKLVPVEVALR
jgi:hypothetical protein